jgi:hypothetical protein
MNGEMKLKMPEQRSGTFDVKPPMPFTVCVIKASGNVEMPKMDRAAAEREAKYQREQGFIVEIIESEKLAQPKAQGSIPAWITGE